MIDDDRFLDLAARCLADEADDGEQRELIAAVEADPDLRRRLLEHVRVDATLRGHVRDIDAFVHRVQARVSAKGRSASFSVAMRERFERERRRAAAWGWMRRLWPLALAMSVLITIGVLLPRGGRVAGPAVVGVVVAVAGDPQVVGAGGSTSAAVGLELRDGDVCRTDEASTLAVRFAAGGVVACAPSTAWTAHADGAWLERGALTAEVAGPRAAPLTVASPALRVEISASLCAIASGPSGDRVDVASGTVRVLRRADGAALDLGADQAVVAAADAAFAARPRRVTGGLLAAWLFDAGAGTVVHAVAGSSDLDLVIGEPRAAEWRVAGLRADPAAEIAARAPLAAIAAIAGRGLTIECWAVAEAGDNDHLLLLDLDTRTRLCATAHSLVPGRLSHIATAVWAEDGRCLARTWVDGAAEGEDVHDLGDASLIDALAAETPRVRVVATKDDHVAPPVELRLLAIYARPLGEDEIRRNFAAGLPQSRGMALAPPAAR